MADEGLFASEQGVIAEAEEFLTESAIAGAAERHAYEALLKEYKKLFKTTRRLMRLSDRNELELRRLQGVAETAKATLSRYFSPNLAKVIVANQDSGHVRVFDRDVETGALEMTDEIYEIPAPNYIRFLDI